MFLAELWPGKTLFSQNKGQKALCAVWIIKHRLLHTPLSWCVPKLFIAAIYCAAKESKATQSNLHSVEIPVIKERVVVVRRAQVCPQVGHGHGVWNRVPSSKELNHNTNPPHHDYKHNITHHTEFRFSWLVSEHTL